MRRLAQPEEPVMGRTIAIGFLGATLYVAPLVAEPSNPAAPAITQPNNDATLRRTHAYDPPPIRRLRVPRDQSNKSP